MSYDPAQPPQVGIITPYGLSPGNPGASFGYSAAQIIAQAQAEQAALFGSPYTASPLVGPSPGSQSPTAATGAAGMGNLGTLALVALGLYFLMGRK